jgi:hypothetical protein
MIENPHQGMYLLSQEELYRGRAPSKLTVTASSTMYAEFVACYEATGQVNWLKKFMPN